MVVEVVFVYAATIHDDDQGGTLMAPRSCRFLFFLLRAILVSRELRSHVGSVLLLSAVR